MKKLVQKLVHHPLVSGSLIIFTGSLFANFLNFIFNWYMRRELINADYGIFASLISLITLPALATAAIVPVIVNYAGKYFSNNQLNLVSGFFKYTLKQAALFSVLLFVFLVIFVHQIGSFFHIDNISLLIVTDVIIALGVLMIINQAFLQAQLSFTFITITNMISSLLKIISGIILINIGFRVDGAIGAVLISFIISYILSYIPLRKLIRKHNVVEVIHTKEIVAYGLPSALAMLALASFISSDILLVKHFFHPDEAGIYAGLSLAARVIYFFSAPIGIVMFPLIVQKYHKGERYRNTFILAMILVLIPSLSLTTLYYLLPDIVLAAFNINVLIYDMPTLLILFAFLITVYSIISILVNFYLSIRATRVYLPLLLAGIIQISVIWYIHESFLQILILSMVILLSLLAVLLLYYPYATKKR